MALLFAFTAVPCTFSLELGSLQGVVKGPTGQPASGVAVALRSTGSSLPLERKTLSDIKGEFQFLSLFPGVYTLQVMALDPLNFITQDLVITAGSNDPLIIHLSDIFAVTFKPPRITPSRDDPTNEAKWVLRTSRATRPILRFYETAPVPGAEANSGFFASLPIRGVLEISAADDETSGSLDTNPFNSSFAFSHSFSPTTQLLVAGGVGFTGANQTSLRSALNVKWDESHKATIALGLRQFGLPLLNTSEVSQAFSALADERTNISQIQNFLVSLDLQDKYQVSDQVELMAGVAFDHIESVRSKNLLRPRVGFTWSPSPAWTFRALAMNTTLERAKTFTLPEGETITLPSMMRMALSPHTTRPESVNHIEWSLERALTPSTHLIFNSTYDHFMNRTLLLTNLDAVNVGQSRHRGYSIVFVTQPRKTFSASWGYSFVGGLEERDLSDLASRPDRTERTFLETRYYHVAVASLKFQIPRTQTQVTALYRQVLGSPLTILDPFQQTFYASEPGLNLEISRPLPDIALLPGHMEAHADFRNLFASSPERHATGLPTTFLSQRSPVVRGGLSFKF